MNTSNFPAWLRGLVHPVSIGVILATALLAELANISFLLPGLALYLFTSYLLGPAKHAQTRRIEELGLDMKDAPPGLKRWNARLHQSLQRVQADLDALSSDRARFLKPVAKEVEALGTDIRRLLRQAHQLYGYLHRTNTTGITQRIEHLESQIAVTQDAYSKQQLVEAAAALRRQIENCEQIRLLISRIEATLENMQASLEAIGSSVVKLGAGELSDANAARQESLQRLSSARGTVASLEEVLEQVELA